MMQNLYLLDVFVNIDTNEVASDICKHYDSKLIGYTFLYSDVRVFNVEATALDPFVYLMRSYTLLL